MKKEYDMVYLTNTPSFYKLNLCEALCRHGVRVLVVFYGYGKEAVNINLEGTSGFGFDYEFLHDGDSRKRNKTAVFLRLLKLMRGVNARKIIYAGWLAPEYNLYSFLSPRSRNVVVSESRGCDVGMTGLRGMVKRCIIGRMSGALPSGIPHKELFDRIGFKGRVECTGSVGLINRMYEADEAETVVTPNGLRFLYVGRLTAVKNLSLLIKVFNANKLPLTIVGKGEDEKMLKEMAGPNIRFMGFVDNDRLGAIYRRHDVFVLPSLYEPWGLVVEEALYHGLPVIVSDRVGCAADMVTSYGSGLIFETDSKDSLQDAVTRMHTEYDSVWAGVKKIDWHQRESRQIDAYLKILELR